MVGVVAAAVAAGAVAAGPRVAAAGDPVVRDPAVALRAAVARAAWHRALRRCRGLRVRAFADRVVALVIESQVVHRWATCRRLAVGRAAEWAIGRAVETLLVGQAPVSVTGPVEETSPIGRARVRGPVLVQEKLPEIDRAPVRAHQTATCRIFLIFQAPEVAISAVAGHRADWEMRPPDSAERLPVAPLRSS